MSRVFRVFAGIGAVLFTFAMSGAVPANADDEPTASKVEKVRAYVQPSVVYIGAHWEGYVFDPDIDDWIGGAEAKLFEVDWTCTGYVVSPNGYIATAGHCVNESDGKYELKLAAANWAVENEVYDPATIAGWSMDQIMESYNVEGEDANDDKLVPSFSVVWGASAGGVAAKNAYPARLISSQEFEKGDAALVKINAHNLIPLRVSAQEPSVGAEVVSVGYPGSVDETHDVDLSPSYKDGTISSKKTTDGGLIPTFEMSAAMSGGMSGGPTVNGNHEVIGTNSYSISGETSEFNFIRPASLMRELVGAAGVKNSLGRVGSDYVAGIDAYFDGDRDRAVEALQKVVDEQPSNAMAQEFLRKSKRLDGGSSLLMTGLIALVAIGALATAGVLLMRRRKSRGTDSGPASGDSAPAGIQGAVPAASDLASLPGTAVGFAAQAGDPVSATAEARLRHFCSACGHQLNEGDTFCGSCGAKVAG